MPLIQTLYFFNHSPAQDLLPPESICLHTNAPFPMISFSIALPSLCSAVIFKQSLLSKSTLSPYRDSIPNNKCRVLADGSKKWEDVIVAPTLPDPQLLGSAVLWTVQQL